MPFEGKVVVITGSGGGIGRGLALAYADRGATVVIVDKDMDKARETESLVINAGGMCSIHNVDLSVPEQVVRLFREAADRWGRVDILINNAGLGVFKSPFDLALEEWDYVINTNLRGTFLCSREAAALMKRQGGGSIVNISSTRSVMSEPNSEAYAASKGGIASLTHALALSLGPDRIRVNAISPGWIETGDYERLREEDHTQHPAQRVGTPGDIAKGCFYLTEPDNDFVTGINLVIDGGMTRKMIYEE
ncbi:3-ketoacyl-ACP reductase [Cohnella kolymensis]|uniref:3-ketoacyl-ACP reductase n=1 Tax=Cohnella kolymensis TaxID=1590652 RepID=A0ABR4ZZB1_9BACL|nr:glucose 1-dehydrogenase [Cohnella kolymensis]KIL34155.1 3-ketoacyl-ACP reductase [Cohnella kolymensis]